MDTRLLKHFLIAFENRNFMRAADELGITKQGLSKSVANLEEAIGAKLFVRSRSGAEPTEFGEALASHARLIIAQTKIAEDEIALLKNADKGLIRLGVTPTLAAEIIPTVVAKVSKEAPEIKIYVHAAFQDGLISGLKDGAIDIVAGSLRPGTEIPATIQKEVLFKKKDAIACRPDHPIVKKAKKSKSKLRLADLEPYPWIVPIEFNWVMVKLNNVFQKAGIDEPRRFTHSGDFNFGRGLIMKSDHLAYGVGAAYHLEIKNGLLSEIYLPQLTETRDAMILTRKDGLLTRAATRLIDDIRATAREHTSE